MSGEEPPLRPLIYTELPPEQAQDLPPEPPQMVNIAPEDLGYTLFHALLEHDRDTYERMFIEPQSLSELVHMKLDAAAKDAQLNLKKSEPLWALFAPTNDAEVVSGGLGVRLKFSEFRLGKARNLAGKLASLDGSDLIQHWGNELRIELVDSDKIFTIRIPKIVKTPQGWRIAQPIELDKTLQIFLETGMHLKMDLLTSEHYPMPLEVGNYWKYAIDRPTSKTAQATDLATDHLQTDTITEIIRKPGYWIVNFERTLTTQRVQEEPEIETKRFSWLATPRMIFMCASDCRTHAQNISYILGYISRQTPIFKFPLHVGQKWDAMGQKTNFNRYEVRAPNESTITVPGGAYTNVYEIFGSIEEGRESRFFVPGTGIVMRIVRSGTGQKRESLLKYRLIF